MTSVTARLFRTSLRSGSQARAASAWHTAPRILPDHERRAARCVAPRRHLAAAYGRAESRAEVGSLRSRGRRCGSRPRRALGQCGRSGLGGCASWVCWLRGRRGSSPCATAACARHRSERASGIDAHRSRRASRLPRVRCRLSDPLRALGGRRCCQSSVMMTLPLARPCSRCASASRVWSNGSVLSMSGRRWPAS
jgi:hypothetical protein